MRALIPFILIALSWGNLVSQDYFVKRLDINNEYSRPVQMIQYENRFYAIFAHLCGSLECSTLVELNTQGDTLWSVENRDMDIAFETMIISNDTITLTGNNDPVNSHFRMAHFDLDGNKLGETMEIKHPTEEFTYSFCLTTQKRNGKFHIMGPSYQDGNAYSLMYVVDPQGELDTLIRIDSTENRCTVFDSDIDEDGNIVTFLKKEEPFGTKTYMKIIKFNQDLDSTWTYNTRVSNSNLSGIKGACSEDKVIFNIFTEGTHRYNHSISSIDQDKKSIIIYEPVKISTNARGFRRIKTLSNGDILGMGLYQDVSQEFPIHESPWLIRMSPEGDIRWHRVFYDLDPTDNEARFGIVSDVVELPNGDLYGIAEMRFEIPTSIIFKIDADGCLDPDDCGLVQFITGTDDFYPQEDIEIYPNPSSDYVTIALSDNRDDHEYIIIDHYGRNVISSTRLVNNEEIDISMLTIGVYYVLIVKEGKIVGSKKVVKK